MKGFFWKKISSLKKLLQIIKARLRRRLILESKLHLEKRILNRIQRRSIGIYMPPHPTSPLTPLLKERGILKEV
jgi:hypothetical protein